MEMALIKSIFCPKYSLLIAVNSYRRIQTSAIRAIDMKWREDRRLHRNPNAHGPLTDFPDYTFMEADRLTPLGSNQKKRVIKQRQLAQRIVTLISEVDAAKEKHQQLREKEQQTKENIIANKFKPKGLLLLKKK